MSSYPPGGDYDERLLDNAPKATKAERQEGYNVNLLASDTSETPINTRPPVTVDGHGSLEAGVSPTKEGYTSPYPDPWYRQGKWRILMLLVAIVVIGAIVGGAVGGSIAAKNRSSDSNHGPSTITLPTSSSSSSSYVAPAQPTQSGPSPPGSSLTPPQSVATSGAGAVPSPSQGIVRGSLPTNLPNDGLVPGVAPVNFWSK